jgi:VWFA-related protein
MNRGLESLAIAVLLCTAIEISAQNEVLQTKPKEERESQEIKVKTELMEVRAVVTDRNGRVLENLKKEDFELLENDQPQEISFFSISQVGSERNQPAAGVSGAQDKVAGLKPERSRPAAGETEPQDKAAGVQTTHERLSAPPVRTTLLFVDNLHLSFSSLNWVKQALRRFIKERLTEQDVVAVATSSQTLGVAQQFTRDQQLLNYAIEQIRLGPFRHENYFTPNLAADVIADRIDAVRLAVDIVRQEQNIVCGCDMLRATARTEASQVLSESSYSRKASLAILQDFAEQMIRLPGKRMIVIFSDGFTLRDNDGDTHNEQLQPAIDRAVRSGVVIYAIDAKGVQTPPTVDASKNIRRSDAASLAKPEPMPGTLEGVEAAKEKQEREACADAPYCPNDPHYCDPRCFIPALSLLEHYANTYEREEMNGLYALADQTGGKMYNDTNNLGDALGRAFDANRYYYVLSYYLRPGGDDRGFRRIMVRVRSHPEYKVQSPRGFLPYDTIAKPETDAGKTPQQRLIQAMRAPLPETDVGISAQAEFMETESDDKQVSLIVYFDGDRLQYREQGQRNVFGLEILYLVYDSSGKQVEGISANVEGRLTPERASQAKTSGYRFSRRLTLKPGVYQVRIGVREEGSDRMGTATAWVQVPEIAHSKLEMSSLILRDPLDTDPAAKEGINVSELEQVRMVRGIPLYSRDDFCDYSFRVHEGTPTPANRDLVWMRELLQGGKPIKQEPWVPIPAEGKNLDSKGWFDVDGEVDLGGFNPGVYELRISVKEARSNKTAQRTAVFSVE